MGLFFTLLYMVTAYLSPPTVWGSLADHHIAIILACLALFCSLFTLRGSRILEIGQTWALIGMTLCVGLSLLFAYRMGLIPMSLMDFIPNEIIFFFIFLNCRKKIHLQFVIMTMFLIAVFIGCTSFYALQTNDLLSPYLLRQRISETGLTIFRIRGLDFLNDPNDLSQFMVALIPCMFFFWSRGKFVVNLFLVYLPICFLLYGMFLTKSRGGMVALMICAVVAGRRKIGIFPALVGGAILFLGMQVSGFSGGRDITPAAGADRMEAWSTGIQLIRTHPFFGVGYKRFANFFYITAHNTVIVCAAEIGLIGFFFWMLFVLPTVRNALATSDVPVLEDDVVVVGGKQLWLGHQHEDPDAAREAKDAKPASDMAFRNAALATPGGRPVAMRAAELRSANSLRVSTPARDTARKPIVRNMPKFMDLADHTDEETNAEIHRLAGLTVLALTGFLSAGWFLSRAYTMTLFLHAGIAMVVYRMALDRGIAPPPLKFLRAAKLSGIMCITLTLLVYLILRIQHLTGK